MRANKRKSEMRALRDAFRCAGGWTNKAIDENYDLVRNSILTLSKNTIKILGKKTK